MRNEYWSWFRWFKFWLVQLQGLFMRQLLKKRKKKWIELPPTISNKANKVEGHLKQVRTGSLKADGSSDLILQPLPRPSSLFPPLLPWHQTVNLRVHFLALTHLFISHLHLPVEQAFARGSARWSCLTGISVWSVSQKTPGMIPAAEILPQTPLSLASHSFWTPFETPFSGVRGAFVARKHEQPREQRVWIYST